MLKVTLFFFIKRVMLSFLIFSIVFPNFVNTADAAAASFVQTSWAGGVTANTATHASNQTGWTEYSAGTDVTAGATTTLESTSYTFTDDGTVSVDPAGSATGGDFDSGTNSNTTVSGSGTGASVALTGTLTTINAWDDPLTVVPGTIGAGSSMIRDGSSNDIYVLQGGGTGFYKYSISGNSWTTLAVVPGAVGLGASMIRNGSSNDIYVIRGTGQTSLYRYSISGDSWATLAVTPAAIGAGSNAIRNSSDNDIYLTQGGSGTGFYRYSISGNSWATLAVSPTAFGTGVGATLLRNGSDNEIYLTQGGAGGGTGFWRYSISGNSWSAMTAYSGGIMSSGAGALRDGSSNDIYAITGNGYDSFYRYSISGNSWTSRAVVPAAVNAGGMMIRNGSDNEIYLIRGSSATGFYKYSISGNSWTTMQAVPASLTTGSFMIRNSSDGEIYVSRGGGTGFYRFVIEDTLYPASGTYTSAVIDTAGASNMGTIAYGAGTTLPTGTSVTFDVRAGNVAVPDGTWTAYTTGIASGGSLNAFDGYRYIQYKINLATTDDTATPTVDEVDITFSQYALTGTLTSNKYDTTTAGNLITKMTWIEEDTSSTEIIKFQIRSSPDGTTWSAWCGYDDCSGTTYFTTANADNGATIIDGHDLMTGNNDRYLQYQASFASAGYLTPELTSARVDYGESVPPSVTTSAASNLSTDTATLNGNITDIGSDTVTARGFDYGMTNAYGYTTSENGTFSAGTYGLPILNLECGQTYNYRAFATNTTGTTNGSNTIFETASCPSGSSGSTAKFRAAFVAKQELLRAAANPPVPTSLATTPPVCTLTLLLKQGSRGVEVKCLQSILKVATDGFFGPITKAAVINFQKNNPPLAPDGIVGPKTRAVIKG